MEKELRELIMYRFGGDVYQQMMQERRRIRDQREQEVHAQQRRREALIENVLYLLGIAAAIAVMGAIANFVVARV
jgi:cell division protein FtsL